MIELKTRVNKVYKLPSNLVSLHTESLELTSMSFYGVIRLFFSPVFSWFFSSFETEWWRCWWRRSGPSFRKCHGCLMFSLIYGSQCRDERNGTIVWWTKIFGSFGFDFCYSKMRSSSILFIRWNRCSSWRSTQVS